MPAVSRRTQALMPVLYSQGAAHASVSSSGHAKHWKLTRAADRRRCLPRNRLHLGHCIDRSDAIGRAALLSREAVGAVGQLRRRELLLCGASAGKHPRVSASLSDAIVSPSARTLELPYGNRTITLETGEVGRQASGAIIATDGETVLYTTACSDNDFASDGSFAPLQINYTERFSAAGRTSGSFFKRDSKQKENEVLVSRLVDRPLRPMIASGWPHSVQVLQWVLSYDFDHSPEPLAITAAGAALALSDVPMKNVVAGVRVGQIDGEFVVNPTVGQMESSKLDLVIAGTREAVLMIEGFCDFLTEDEMLEAVRMGQEAIAEQCLAIEAWSAELGKEKRTEDLKVPPEGLDKIITDLIGTEIENAYRSISLKKERGEAVAIIKEKVKEALILGEDETEQTSPGKYDATTVSMALKRVESRIMRNLVLREGYRADGRGIRDVRPIWSRASMLPRTHGSALFTRGETQAIAVTTLGCKESAQRVDSMASEEDEERRFYLQYFFPPSSVGETGRVGAPGRREIGHGNLAERALVPIVPSESEFPYTIRVESTITESNGSSSMASVCGGCLSMMDAGVPIDRMVAGVAMGLILEPDGSFVVLTDILGSEDALGDMDFKVAGDDNGVTAFQMDIKVEGITLEIMKEALSQAKEGRKHILGEMRKCSPPPRKELSPYSPRIAFMSIPVDKIGTVIGAGGRTARAIQEETGVDLNFDQDGELQLKGPNDAALELAREMVLNLVTDPEPGRVYRSAKVVQVTNFGAFVELAPKKDGLLHVSEWDFARTASIADVVEVGDTVDVMVLEVSGSNGKIKLSRKAVLELDGLKPTDAPDAESDDDADNGAMLDKQDLKPGAILRGARVKQVQGYGAFVQVSQGRDALLHVSEWDTSRTETMSDVCSEGDLVDIMILEVEDGNRGKIRASRKALLGEDGQAMN